MDPSLSAVTEVPGMASLGLQPERPALNLGRVVWGADGRPGGFVGRAARLPAAPAAASAASAAAAAAATAGWG